MSSHAHLFCTWYLRPPGSSTYVHSSMFCSTRSYSICLNCDHRKSSSKLLVCCKLDFSRRKQFRNYLDEFVVVRERARSRVTLLLELLWVTGLHAFVLPIPTIRGMKIIISTYEPLLSACISYRRHRRWNTYAQWEVFLIFVSMIIFEHENFSANSPESSAYLLDLLLGIRSTVNPYSLVIFDSSKCGMNSITILAINKNEQCIVALWKHSTLCLVWLCNFCEFWFFVKTNLDQTHSTFSCSCSVTFNQN